MNALGLGPNVALSLFDVSQAGARVTVKAPLTLREQIEIGLSGIGHRRPVKNLATWSGATRAPGELSRPA